MRQYSRAPLAAFLLSAIATPCALAKEPPLGENVATMRVDGEIEVGPDGRVADHKITTEVTDEIRTMIGRKVVDWKFDPPKRDRVPVAARGKMRIVLSARNQGDDYAVQMDNVTFPADTGPHAPRGRNEVVGAKGRYHRFQAAGAITLVLRVAPDGTILDAFPSQCAVFAAQRGVRPANACEGFERYAATFASKIKVIYRPAPGEPMPTKPRTGTLPLYFQLGEHGKDEAKAGEWRAQWRTPYQRAPWLEVGAPRVGASDVTPDDGFFADSQDLRLQAGHGVGASD